MEPDRKYRITLCANGPQCKLAFLYADTLEGALVKLRKLSDAGLFSSSAYPVPGTDNIALLEKWDEDLEEWLYYVERKL